MTSSKSRELFMGLVSHKKMINHLIFTSTEVEMKNWKITPDLLLKHTTENL